MYTQIDYQINCISFYGIKFIKIYMSKKNYTLLNIDFIIIYVFFYQLTNIIL